MANEVWRGSCAELRQTAKPEENLERFNAERGPAFARITDANNKQMREQVNPNYRKMVMIFRENLSLAEPETEGYFAILVEYVDVSERWTAQTIPREVVGKLAWSTAALTPFIEHVRETHERLRAWVARGGD
ncbi:MAG: hypothetical protein ACYDA9_17500 [Terriglobia bacterium]